MSSIIEVKKALERAVLSIDGVNGIGLTLDESTIVIYAERMTDVIAERIQLSMAGYPVKVEVIGRITTNFANFELPSVDITDINLPGLNVPIEINMGDLSTLIDPITKEPLKILNDIDLPLTSVSIRKQRWKPIIGGISAAHKKITAGTLGGIVYDSETGEPLFLSNNHVFANASTTTRQDANAGDPIYQPSTYDGGLETDKIATLERWIPFQDGITNRNIADCAVAKPLPGTNMIDAVLGEDDKEIIQVNGIAPINNYNGDLKIKVKKAGRTTGYTEGYIKDINFTTISDYGDGKIIRFVDQILVDINLDGGDSGSLLLNDQNQVIGLVFAGTDIDGKRYAVANKIRNVTSMLNIDIPENTSIPTSSIQPSVSTPYVVSTLFGFGIGMIIAGATNVGYNFVFSPTTHGG